MDRAGARAFPRAQLVLSATEWAGLPDPAGLAAMSADDRAGAERVRRAVLPYAADVRPLDDGDELAPGLKARALPGHTAGHAGLEVRDGNRVLLFIGDLIHSADVQLPDPDRSVIYDKDPLQAAATRRAVLRRAVDEGCLLFGAHLDPSAGPRVIAAAGQGFR